MNYRKYAAKQRSRTCSTADSDSEKQKTIRFKLPAWRVSPSCFNFPAPEMIDVHFEQFKTPSPAELPLPNF